MSRKIGLFADEPNRIDAILVPRVLTNKSHIFNFSFPVPDIFGPFPLPSGSFATFVLKDTSCQILYTLPQPSTCSPSSKLAIVLVSPTAEIKIFNHYGIEKCTYTATANSITTVLICNNLELTYEVTSASLLNASLINEIKPYVMAEIFICLTVTEQVCLLIPTFGFCTPRPCPTPSCLTYPSCQP